MKKGKYSRKRGYALSILMVALVVISIGVAAAVPILSMKKDTFANTSKYVKECIADQNADDLNSTACAGAVDALTKGFNKDYESVLYYLNNSTYTTNALKVIRASCDAGGGRACNVFLDRCAVDSSQCDIADSSNDLDYYLKLASSDVSLGKSYLLTKGLEYYLQGMSGFNNIINAACNGDMTRTACGIAAETKTMAYNFNVPQRSDFYESNPTTGTQFHDGIVDLMLGNGVSWANQYGGNNPEGGTPDDIANAIQVSGSYVYIAGYEMGSAEWGNHHKPFIMKLNIADGTVVWKKKWHVWGGMFFNSMVVSGSNIYVTGGAWDGENYWDNGSLLVMKLVDSGADASVVWERRYGNPANNHSFGLDMKLSGGYLYIGGEINVDGGLTALVLKMQESDGQIIWKNQYGSPGHNYGVGESAAGIDVSGSYIYITGNSYIVEGEEVHYCAYIAKMRTSDGCILWKKAYGDGLWTACISVSGGYIYIGGGAGFSADVASCYLMKVRDPDPLNGTEGETVWRKKYGDSNWGGVGKILTSGSYIYATGSEASDTAGGGADILGMKVNTSDGSVVWKKQFGGADNEYSNALALSGGSLYFAGSTRSQSNDDFNIIVMRTDETPPFSNISQWVNNGEDFESWGFGNNHPIQDGIDGWTYEGVTLDNEPITDWTVPDSANQNIGQDISSGYWDTDCVDIVDGTDWNQEGTTLDTEPIDFFTIGLNNSAYITTTDNNHITNILGGIKSCGISATEPANTKIRGLVSFDGRGQWKKWDGDSWENETTDLTTYNFSSNGNTIAQIQAGLTNLTIGNVSGQTGRLDFAFYLETDNTATVSPSIDSVTITYLRER